MSYTDIAEGWTGDKAVGGGFVGASPYRMFITNAGAVQQLEGPFRTYWFTVALLGGFGIQCSTNGRTLGLLGVNKGPSGWH